MDKYRDIESSANSFEIPLAAVSCMCFTQIVVDVSRRLPWIDPGNQCHPYFKIDLPGPGELNINLLKV